MLVKTNVIPIFPFPPRAAESGIAQKWNKLRRRCASFKSTPSSHGPASLDSEAATAFILSPDDARHASVQLIPRQASADPPSSDMATPRGRPVISHQQWMHNISDKYDYDSVNLHGSLSGEKASHRIPLPHEYWGNQSVRERPRRSSHHTYTNAKDLDWEFNVQQYEQLVERPNDRLQYYEANPITNQTVPPVDAKKKELRFPGLKSFKSASMRLPGQKSSIAEVQQLLRVKFNRINIGLRKRRALSVQEVFNHPRSSSQPPVATENGASPTQFYVPSPLMGQEPRSSNLTNNNNYKCIIEDDTSGPTSLPYFVNAGEDDATTQPNAIPSKDTNRSTARPSQTPPPPSSTLSKSGTLLRRSHSNNYHSNAPTVALAHRTANDLGPPEQTTKQTPPRKPQANRTSLTTSSSSSTSPQFLVGGCVTPPAYTPRRPKQATTTAGATSATDPPKIRLRPRSHSPLKTGDDPLKSTRKKRESFGFFERINRMMGHGSHNANHSLPPPHNNGRSPVHVASSPTNRINGAPNRSSAIVNNENNPNQTNSSANTNGLLAAATITSPSPPPLRCKASSPATSNSTASRNIKNLTLSAAAATRPTESPPKNGERRNSTATATVTKTHQQPEISLLRDRMTTPNKQLLLQVRIPNVIRLRSSVLSHTARTLHGLIGRL